MHFMHVNLCFLTLGFDILATGPQCCYRVRV